MMEKIGDTFGVYYMNRAVGKDVKIIVFIIVV